MSENITKSITNRQLNIGLHPENFVNVNYFNESMINRMRIEHKIAHGLESSNEYIQCASWNSNGHLFASGKYEKGVQIFKPFQNTNATFLPVQRDHYLTNALFLQKYENLIAVCSRNHGYFTWGTANGLEADEYVKIWDLETNSAIRSYNFKGFVKQVASCKALPNCVWFNVDHKAQVIAEADIRCPSYNSILLNDAESNTSLFQLRTFDVNPVDGVTIVVGDKNKILFHDRRMISTSKVNHPTKTVDISSFKGDSSYIVKLTYNPSGNKLFISSSYSTNNFQYVAPASDSKVENIREFTFQDQFLDVILTKYPSFLGEKYVIFDAYFRNYSVVFNHEDMRYIGKINFLGQSNYFSDISSMPHPFYCLIASTKQDAINFITPTSYSDEV